MVDELDQIEIEFQKNRAARKVERRIEARLPDAIRKRTGGRAARNKGGKDEREFENDYYPFGFIKTADSGSSSQLPDIQRPIQDGRILQYGEKKFRRSGDGWKTLNTWMEQNRLNQFLVLDCRLGERLWVVKDSMMRNLLQEAGYDTFTPETSGFVRWTFRAKMRKGLQKFVDKLLEQKYRK